MDIEKWKVLISALDCGTLAAAAECTNYTTSGVSRIIAGLEADTGFRLLTRGRKGVKPTKECLILLNEVRELIASEEALEQKIARIKGLDTGTLTIGTAYSSSYSLLSGIVARFVKEYPSIKVSIVWDYASKLREELDTKVIDIAMTRKADGEEKFLWLPIYRTRLVALVPERHSSADKKEFPIENFVKYPYIEINPTYESDSNKLLRDAGIRPNTRYTTSDSIAALALVKAELGTTMLIETQVPAEHPGIRILPLTPEQDFEIGLYYLKRPSLTTSRFLSFIGRDESLK